jgi:transposase
MRTFTFTEDELQAIRQDRYHHPDPQVQRRMDILWFKHHGLTHEGIAALAGVARATVQRCLDDYLAGGLDRLRRGSPRGPRSLLEQHRTSLEEYFRQHPPPTIRAAQQVIEERTGLRRGPTQVRRFLQRLGLRPRRVAAIPLPPNTPPDEHTRVQRAFVDEQLEPKLAEARAGQRDVCFVDASHFVYAALLGWVWCWVRQYVRSAAGRKRYSVLGALHAVSHQLITVTNHTYVNAQTVCELLQALAAASVGRPITVVLDNARYQKCALVTALAARLGIELLYLPSYSPNLNLIERVWKYVKKQLRAGFCAHYTTFTSTMDGVLSELPNSRKSDMDTLLTHQFQTWEDVSLVAA